VTEEEQLAHIDAGQRLAQDIHARWPEWVAMVKDHKGYYRSAHMFVASQLIGQAIMAMLWLGIPEAAVDGALEDMLDTLTDADVVKAMTDLRDDKTEILAYYRKIMKTNVEKLSARRGVN
jgi:hypothetical protein